MAQPEHKCIHESRWKSFFSWKERVNNFITAKEVTNGNTDKELDKLQEEDKDLAEQMKNGFDSINGRIDALLIGLVIAIIGMFALIRIF